MSIDINRITGLELIKGTIGVANIKIISNEFKEIPGYEGETGSYQKIVFQVEEDDPDIFAIGLLFSLSLMSFTFASYRGYSENDFIPDEEWNLGYFIQCLSFENGSLHLYADYVSGRMMKTDIRYESRGKVTMTTINRGKSADRWMTHLQGKKNINLVKK